MNSQQIREFFAYQLMHADGWSRAGSSIIDFEIGSSVSGFLWTWILCIVLGVGFFNRLTPLIFDESISWFG